MQSQNKLVRFLGTKQGKVLAISLVVLALVGGSVFMYFRNLNSPGRVVEKVDPITNETIYYEPNRTSEEEASSEKLVLGLYVLTNSGYTNAQVAEVKESITDFLKEYNHSIGRIDPAEQTKISNGILHSDLVVGENADRRYSIEVTANGVYEIKTIIKDSGVTVFETTLTNVRKESDLDFN